jgi:hypothetical protein
MDSREINSIFGFYFFFILTIFFYYDKHMHNYFTNYHTPTRFDSIVSSLGSL